MSSLERKLRMFLRGKVALVGTGNIMKADDGAGPRLVQSLTGRVKAVLFDAGVSPENHLGPILRAKPHTVIVVDAFHFNGRPGSVRLFTKKDFVTAGFSTHTMDLNHFVGFLEENGVKNVIILGIQPATVNFDEELSRPVQRALADLQTLFHSLSL